MERHGSEFHYDDLQSCGYDPNGAEYWIVDKAFEDVHCVRIMLVGSSSIGENQRSIGKRISMKLDKEIDLETKT